MQEMVTIAQYSEIMGLHIGSIRRLCNQGQIPGAIKVGGRWRIPYESYEPPTQAIVIESEQKPKERDIAFEAAAYNLAITLRQAACMVESALEEYRATI